MEPIFSENKLQCKGSRLDIHDYFFKVYLIVMRKDLNNYSCSRRVVLDRNNTHDVRRVFNICILAVPERK